jgi:hypothetical protein
MTNEIKIALLLSNACTRHIKRDEKTAELRKNI